MRLRFSASSAAIHRAKHDSTKSAQVQLRRWWSKKYTLPPNHPLFEDRSYGSLLTEYYEDVMDRRQEVADMMAQGLGNRTKQLELLRDIDALLGDTKTTEDVGTIVTGDPEVDEWERQIARGELPDWMRD